MTFKEALNTGYKVTQWTNSFYWIKKINEKQCIDEGEQIFLIQNLIPTSDGWFIHPEDQKLIDFNNKLDTLLETT